MDSVLFEQVGVKSEPTCKASVGLLEFSLTEGIGMGEKTGEGLHGVTADLEKEISRSVEDRVNFLPSIMVADES